jgi:hypothetical protein
MRTILLPIALAVAVAGCATSGYTWNGQTFATREECLAAKQAAGDMSASRDTRGRTATVGAATAGTVAAVAGANLAETALVAGAGAATGAAMGKRRC